MRPPAKVIVLDTNELRLSHLRFVLRVRGTGWRSLRILGATSAEEAAEIARNVRITVLIVHWPIAGVDLPRLFAALHDVDPELRTLVLPTGGSEVPESVIATCVMPRRWDLAAVFEQLCVLCARKRGPHKGFKRKPVATVAAADVSARRTA